MTGSAPEHPRRTRLIRFDDAPTLAELLTANEEYLRPWEPLRDARTRSAAGQEAEIAAALSQWRSGQCLPHVILDDVGCVIGRITISAIARGPFQSGNLGYWVSEPSSGQGYATSAVAAVRELAFGSLGLHRLQAGTLVRNVASQRVLERNGFVRFGVAPAYLRIAGRWQDHVLYQVTNDDWEVTAAAR